APSSPLLVGSPALERRTDRDAKNLPTPRQLSAVRRKSALHRRAERGPAEPPGRERRCAGGHGQVADGRRVRRSLRLAGAVAARLLLGGLGPGLGQPAKRRGRGASAGVAQRLRRRVLPPRRGDLRLRSELPGERKPALGSPSVLSASEPALRASRRYPGGGLE